MVLGVGGTLDQAFLLQGFHGWASGDELLELVLHVTPVRTVKGAVFQPGAAEHIWRRKRGSGSDRVSEAPWGLVFSLVEGVWNQYSLMVRLTL